jgi:hypothetical protein
MSEIKAIGMVIYTYGMLEERLEGLWNWLREVERWSGQPYGEFSFSPRGKVLYRIWKATAKNMANLYRRLQTEQPWGTLFLGWPVGTQKGWQHVTKGLYLIIGSTPQPLRGGESYRSPSEIYLGMRPSVISGSVTGISGLLDLGLRLWEIVDGVYGFIDVETGVPLQDDIYRNAIFFWDTTVPPEFQREFRAWQGLSPTLNKRVWKAFWGNFLGAEHLQELGGIRELRRADPLYRLLPEYLQQAYQQGLERLRASNGYYEWRDLARGGVLLTLSTSPLEWFEKKVQERRARLQEALEPIALKVEEET